MRTRLHLDILRQPDDSTCGPTCLHAVYRYFGEKIPLDRVLEETQMLEGGGTLVVHLARHALRRGYRATIYTFNLHMFDPTWFLKKGTDVADRLRAQRSVKTARSMARSTKAYLDFLEHGGKLCFEDLRPSLIRGYLKRGVPILTGLSATYLYRSARERSIGNRLEYDDAGGEPTGHFVVLCGYAKKERSVLVADPYFANPSQSHWYQVGMDRLIGAIMLGALTHDANLLVLEPQSERPPPGLSDAEDEPKRRRRPVMPRTRRVLPRSR